MIRSYGVNLIELIAKCESFVDDELQELVRGGFACQKLELLVDRAPPGYDDS
jgi:hypothetical protein